MVPLRTFLFAFVASLAILQGGAWIAVRRRIAHVCRDPNGFRAFVGRMIDLLGEKK